MIKRTLTIIFLFFCIKVGHTQSTFQRILRSPLNQNVGNIIETSTGDLIVPIITLSPAESKILKFNKEGNIIDSLVINNIQNCIATLFKYNEDSFFACGYLLENNKYYFCLRKYNYNFQQLKELIVPISGFFNVFVNPIILNNKNNLVIAFSSDSTYNLANANMLEISTNCEILKYKKYGFYTLDYINEIIQKDSLYYAYVGGLLNKAPFCVVYKMDSLFNILSIYNPPPMDIDDMNNSVWINDSTILLSGRTDNSITHKIETKIVKIKVDTCLHPIKYNVFARTDSNNNPAFRKNLDFFDVNNVYKGSFVTKDVGGYFSHYYSKIELCKFDSALNVIWKKEYGGDAVYLLISIKATQDGGCIMAGARYDYRTQTDEESDPFIIKVNSQGNFLWVHNLPKEFTSINPYPNPGRDKLSFTNLPDKATINLYNIKGQLIYNKPAALSENIDTSLLPSGMYIYTVYDEKGQVLGKGKWIKE